MNNIRDKFEAWAKAHEIDITINPAPSYDARLYNDDETDAMYCGWQAATEQSQKEIEALQAREEMLVEALRYVNKELIMYGYQYESKDSINVVLNEALANVRGE